MDGYRRGLDPSEITNSRRATLFTSGDPVRPGRMISDRRTGRFGVAGAGGIAEKCPPPSGETGGLGEEVAQVSTAAARARKRSTLRRRRADGSCPVAATRHGPSDQGGGLATSRMGVVLS